MKNSILKKIKNNINIIKGIILLILSVIVIVAVIFLDVFIKIPIYIKVELSLLMIIPSLYIIEYYYKIIGKEEKIEKLQYIINKIGPKGEYAGVFFIILVIYIIGLLSLALFFPKGLAHYCGEKYLEFLLYIFFTITILVLVYVTPIVCKLISNAKNEIFEINETSNTQDIQTYCRIIAYIISIAAYITNNSIKFGIKMTKFKVFEVFDVFRDIGLESILTFIMIDTLIQIIIDSKNKTVK